MITYQDIKSGAVPAPVAKVDANSIPSLIDRASKRLSEAKTSAEVLEAKAAAELALHYAKVTKAANESHADCLRIITRAEIRMANEVDRGQAAGEVAKRGGDRQSNVPASDNGAKLSELGISRQRVNEWRKVAEAGEEKVEQAISEALADGRAPTKADVHRAAGIVKEKPKSNEDQQFEDLQSAWHVAGEGARTRFLAANNLRQEAYSNAGGGDVDRSATRASSAVEVGATNSPDGADETRGGLPVAAASGTAEETGRTPAYTRTGRSGTPTVAGVTGGESAASSEGSHQSALVSDMADRGNASGNESVTAGETASNSNSSEPSSSQALTDSPVLTSSPASGTNLAGPRVTAVSGGEPGTPSPDDGGAKMEGVASAAPGQPDPKSVFVSTQSEQAAPFNNPRCQHPETCHLAHSRNECFDCNLAWSKRPKDEQVRLWAEAVQAARAA